MSQTATAESSNAMDPEHVLIWRERIAQAPDPELGTTHWPRVLGWALDEIESLRSVQK